MLEKTTLNIAFYKFFEFPDYLEKRLPWTEQTQGLGLRGKIILSPEGINGFLAGSQKNVDAFREVLSADPRLSDLIYKESWSEHPPFRRMLVKLKKELVPLQALRPYLGTGKYLSPQELKTWLDEKRDFYLVDTRNDYEYQKGTFSGAEDWQLQHFNTFAQKLQTELPRLRQKPVVMFCTGGIRCEKATAYAKNLGLDAYQLEGGILNYFEKVGDAHWKGNCFVFDERVSLSPKLNAEKDIAPLPLGVSCISKPYAPRTNSSL